MKRSILVLSVLTLAGCADKLLSDDRIRDNTALVLHTSANAVMISDRQYDGMTNTYYTARTKNRVYSCVINGGTVMAMGMTNRPECSPR
jgi:metal-dependent hydrolase (beta-lactamase superfamily II)